jgi:hypothetical protein
MVVIGDATELEPVGRRFMEIGDVVGLEIASACSRRPLELPDIDVP